MKNSDTKRRIFEMRDIPLYSCVFDALDLVFNGASLRLVPYCCIQRSKIMGYKFFCPLKTNICLKPYFDVSVS